MKTDFLKRTAFDYFVKGLDFWRRDILDRLDKIEHRLKRYLNCPFCGFDQGKPDPYFGTGLTPTFMKLMKGVDTGVKTATEMAMEHTEECHQLYRWLNGKTDKKPPIADKILKKLAGECTCPHIPHGLDLIIEKVNPLCPVHGTVKECICHFDVNNPIGTERFRIVHKDCPIHGECTCPLWLQKEGGIAFTCPIHGECYGGWYHDKSECTHPERCRLHPRGKCTCKAGQYKSYSECLVHKDTPMAEPATKREKMRLGSYSNPDLPLHVRVAEALGKEVVFEGKWYQANKELNDRFGLIPDYPNDLVAAMGALEEYCEKNNLKSSLVFGGILIIGNQFSNRFWTLGLAEAGGTFEYPIDCQSPAQAICEAIVAHAEGK